MQNSINIYSEDIKSAFKSQLLPNNPIPIISRSSSASHPQISESQHWPGMCVIKKLISIFCANLYCTLEFKELQVQAFLRSPSSFMYSWLKKDTTCIHINCTVCALKVEIFSSPNYTLSTSKEQIVYHVMYPFYRQNPRLLVNLRENVANYALLRCK